jgi:AmmeMemoRadiSam system protein A
MQESVSTITPEQGRGLLQLARKTLLERFGGKLSQEQEAAIGAQVNDPALQQVCGTFVTLKIGDRLRGCIGSLVGREPLVEGVKTHAVNAAFHDPRFPSLSSEEFDHVSIEVSVLSNPEPLEYTDAADLLSKLRPHVDGVTIGSGHCSATFLPQVWGQLPDPQSFLAHLCLKAGLKASAWRDERLQVETYQVQYFEESPEKIMEADS